ncbi:MAG: translation initiation factor IF-2 [Clostridia bacterium]|nr:translation initiation factor IF-2 [Clostridia bacterium]
MTTTKTNNTADRNQNQSWGNLKNLKTYTRSKAQSLLTMLDEIWGQINQVSVRLDAKRSEYMLVEQQKYEAELKKTQEAQDKQEKVSVDTQVQQSVEGQPFIESTPDTGATTRPAVNVSSAQPQDDKEQVQQPPETQSTQQTAVPVVEPPQKPPKTVNKPSVPTNTVKITVTKPTITSTIPASSGGISQKTYTDEKGVVKVRKFLQTPTPVIPQRSNTARTDKRDYHPQGNRPTDRPFKPNTKPSMSRTPSTGDKHFAPKDKDGNSTYTRTQTTTKKSYTPAIVPPTKEGKTYGNKNKSHEKPDEKKLPTKKTLITKTFTGLDDDEKVRTRLRTPKKQDTQTQTVIKKIESATVNTQIVPIKILSEKIGKPATEIVKALFKEGIVKRINDSIEYEYAAYIANLLGVELELKIEKTAEDIMTMADQNVGLPDDTKRPPIVTVMGHVDHGKTSLLDAIRKTDVTSSEAGGITQHIGAYTVTVNGEQITFIDTPGHAAFTKMRARGAKVTDVSIIVVAADDGVMPQTVEAINHSKAAGVSIIVAINKMDKPEANIDKVKQQLAEYDLLAEDWGGDIIMVPVSAKSKLGLDVLLESILLVTEIKELRANPKKKAVGTVIESKVHKSKGPVATILVSNGTLRVGDSLIAGVCTGKIRAMFDDKGRSIKSAGPSCPVEVLGFSDVPNAGDYMYVADEKLVRKVAEERKTNIKIEATQSAPLVSLGDLFGRINEGKLKTLNLIIKTDVQGSLDAVRESLKKISNDEVNINPIHGGVGGINETDVMLAKASDAIIIGFNVRADNEAKVNAEREGVDIRLYSVIYDAVDDITSAMKGMLAPKYKEVVVGTATVREIFKISSIGTVAGCYVNSGKVIRNGKVRLFRNNIVVNESNIAALKRFKDDVKEVNTGYECGISLENFNDIKVDDVFEVYDMEQIQQ